MPAKTMPATVLTRKAFNAKLAAIHLNAARLNAASALERRARTLLTRLLRSPHGTLTPRVLRALLPYLSPQGQQGLPSTAVAGGARRHPGHVAAHASRSAHHKGAR